MTKYLDRDSHPDNKIGTIIDGVPPGVCIFCGFMTSIDFDQDLHIYENHRKSLWQLPIRGSTDSRMQYAIMLGKPWMR
jgi:hypothetical protein